MESEFMKLVMIWVTIGFVFCTISVATFADVARKDFGSTGKKALWGFIALFPFVGWVIYLVFGFRKGTVIDYSGDGS